MDQLISSKRAMTADSVLRLEQWLGANHKEVWRVDQENGSVSFVFVFG
jgi:plasmid maintenance system antidote protein VapI